MKIKNMLTRIGLVVCLLLIGMDRFVCKVPNILYLPVMIAGVVCIVLGFFKDREKTRQSRR